MKEEIAKKVIEGLTRFQLNRETSLTTDWSKNGVGFVMSQKYCDCATISPTCCRSGWKTCMIGSRFTNRAESNYAPIEGELLAVTYGLRKTRYYTLGLDKLTICVDHKPLLGIVNDGEFEKIDNSRLFKLKEKTLGWRFKVIHLPGKAIKGTDALSRAPSAADTAMLQHFMIEDANEGDTSDDIDMLYGLRSLDAEDIETMEDGHEELLATMDYSVSATSWARIKKEISVDNESQALLNWIRRGCDVKNIPANLSTYRKHSVLLRECEGVPMLGDRTIIPIKLRPEILDTLHAAHQGIYSMTLRATDTVYWPGFIEDIKRRRDRCYTCTSIAPSQPNLPPVEPETPLYPFQHICMDHFNLNGKTYGIVVDRFTGWPCIYVGDSSVDACKMIARLSEDYGIPESISTDGAANYTSQKMESFLRQYGIYHRVSSVANAHSNCRAELGVKTMKRLIRDNVSLTGNLDTVKLSRALLQYRNTRDRDIGKSPAEMLMGRQLRDFLPRPKELLMGPTWQRLAEQREQALAERCAKLKERLTQNTKTLEPLHSGEWVVIQNQVRNFPRRWDKTGTVLEPNGFDQYRVVTDGSRRITLRNRKFLRKIQTPEERSIAIGSPRSEETEQVGKVQHDGHQEGPAETPWIEQQVEDKTQAQEDNGCQEEQNDAAGRETTSGSNGEEVVELRRSLRSSKGQTSKYDDFVV